MGNGQGEEKEKAERQSAMGNGQWAMGKKQAASGKK